MKDRLDDPRDERAASFVSARSIAQDPETIAAVAALVRGPLKPLPVNVTPPTRTPWGGHAIYGRWKIGLPGVPSGEDREIVGESWEISDDPAFPSVIPLDAGGRRRLVALSDLLSLHADEILGASVAQDSGGLPVLVKLIDARDTLSVQVHPPRDHPVLSPGESGKTEAWVILEREPGAGLFLGLEPDADRETLRRALARDEDLTPLLHFVPVEPGDVYAVPAGTVHAIGAGCTLMEVQRFSPPSSGVTYRLWDWRRRYDDRGRPDPHGRPRPLHVEQALAVVDFDAPRGEASARAMRRAARVVRAVGGSEDAELIDGLDGLRLHRLSLMTGAPLPLRTGGGFVGLTCTRGQVSLVVPTGVVAATLLRGESVLLPASLPVVELVAHGWSEVYAVTLDVG